MSYSLKQYNYDGGLDENSIFSEAIDGGEALRDNTVMSNVYLNEILSFKESGFTFDSNEAYYFHGMIKRKEQDQIFYVKLIREGIPNSDTQYIKTIKIAGGNTTEWEDVNFIFSPSLGANQFDAIGFQLVRTNDETTDNQRFAKISYLEVSNIKNLLGTDSIAASELIRFGIQTRPGFLSCINKEAIMVNKTGIYELRNSRIRVDMFGVIADAPVGDMTRQELIDEGNERPESSRTVIGSYSYLDLIDATKRNISAFALDYIYEE